MQISAGVDPGAVHRNTFEALAISKHMHGGATVVHPGTYTFTKRGTRLARAHTSYTCIEVINCCNSLVCVPENAAQLLRGFRREGSRTYTTHDPLPPPPRPPSHKVAPTLALFARRPSLRFLPLKLTGLASRLPRPPQQGSRRPRSYKQGAGHHVWACLSWGCWM